MKRLFFLSVYLCCLKATFAQEAQLPTENRYAWRKETSWSLPVGINLQGWDSLEYRWMLEAGLHKTRILYHRHGPSLLTAGVSALRSLEKDAIYGFRAGVWMNALLSLGISATYYTDFNLGNLKITPEFGFGVERLKVSVGFNIPTIRNRDFERLRRAKGQIMFVYLIKAKTVPQREHNIK